MTTQKATSLRRGISILLALASDDADVRDGVGVVRLAELLGHDKSQVSRSLATLSEYGLVERDPRTLGFSLGPQLFALAAHASDRRLLEGAPLLLSGLVAQLGEGAHLTVLHGVAVLTLRSESPAQALQATDWVGRAVPAYCSASGRALLFDASPVELERRFAGVEFAPLGPSTVRSVDELASRIATSSRRGYALVDEELELGLVAAAAPVRDFDGRIVAALNVSAPKFRFRDRLDEAGLATKAAAAELSRLLGRQVSTRS